MMITIDLSKIEANEIRCACMVLIVVEHIGERAISTLTCLSWSLMRSTNFDCEQKKVTW